MSADADEVSEPSSWFSSPPTESPPPKQCTGLKECTRLAFMHVSAAVFAGLAWSRAVMIAWSAASGALLWLATRPKVLMSSIGRVAMLGPRVWIRGAVTYANLLVSGRVRLLIAFTAGVSATRAHAHIKALLSPPSRHFFAQIYAATSSFVRWAIGLEPKEAEISTMTARTTTTTTATIQSRGLPSSTRDGCFAASGRWPSSSPASSSTAPRLSTRPSIK